MEITVTLQLQGEPQEVATLLEQIGQLLEGNPAVTSRQNGRRPRDRKPRVPEGSAWWTPERADTFVRALTPPALQALGIIAGSAPRVTFRELQQKMGAQGMQLAGRLSSIGFAVTRQQTPYPFVRDYYQRTYFMDERVAAILRPAVERELARRPSKIQQARRRSARTSRRSASPRRAVGPKP